MAEIEWSKGLGGGDCENMGVLESNRHRYKVTNVGLSRG
jgi:hypothetical protein